MRTTELSAQSKHGRLAGFTLVELVVVIAVLGIISVGSVTFLRYTIDGYGQSETRAELAAMSTILLARMTSDLEQALPNSVRSNGSCVEFLAVRETSRYLDAPRVTAGTTVRIEAIAGSVAAPAAARIAINPDATEHVYDDSAGIVSPAATFSVPDGDGIVTATLASPFVFAEDSPQQRVHLVDGPVSYCVDGEQLYRYRGYAISAVQPTPATLPSSSAGRQLLAEGIDATGTAFSSAAGSLVRNGVVSVRLTLVRGDDRIGVLRLVHVRGLP